MNTYEFILDEKVTVWNRVRFEIEAASLDEAKKEVRMKAQQSEDVSMFGGNCHYETLFDTESAVDPDDNAGDATLEYIYEHSQEDGKQEIIWSNVTSKDI